MIKTIHRMEWLAALAAVQVLVLNQMHVGGYATPFFFIYFILKINSRMGRNTLMLWAFAAGLVVDVFSNTPGMNAAAATCLAFVRAPLLRLTTLRDMDEGFRPGVKTMGFSAFLRFSLLASALFCSLLWMMEVFSFFDVPVLLLKMLTSTVTTVLCVLCAESMGRKKA